MAQINACLKRTFTFFNLLFAILGGVIIALALVSQMLSRNNGDELEGRTEGLIVLYVLGASTMFIALLGAFGAMKENKVSLIVFLVCMVLGTFFMWKAGVKIATSRPEADKLLEERLRSLIPLDSAPESAQNQMSTMQSTFQCCGLFSYEDWEKEIPSSCECNEQQMEGKCQTIQDPRHPFLRKTIFRETCFPILVGYVDLVVNIVLAIVFSVATLAVLGMILSSMMIHQLRVRVDRPTMVLTIPAVFSTPPPKYQELHNTPPY